MEILLLSHSRLVWNQILWFFKQTLKNKSEKHLISNNPNTNFKFICNFKTSNFKHLKWTDSEFQWCCPRWFFMDLKLLNSKIIVLNNDWFYFKWYTLHNKPNSGYSNNKNRNKILNLDKCHKSSHFNFRTYKALNP